MVAVKNKELLSLLGLRVGPVLAREGLSPLKDRTGLASGWFRARPWGGYLTVWLQADKWPFDPWVGSRFVLELQRAPEREIGATGDALRLRFGDLLSEVERREVRDRQNRVIAKCRVPTDSEHRAALGFPLVAPDLYESQCEIMKEDFGPKEDVWMRYLDRGDVEEWGLFLADWLPRGLERFESRDVLLE